MLGDQLSLMQTHVHKQARFRAEVTLHFVGYTYVKNALVKSIHLLYSGQGLLILIYIMANAYQMTSVLRYDSTISLATGLIEVFQGFKSYT